MTLFEQVKECVTARQAAEHYGIKVKRNGMACCPFHKDRHPSMKADKIYHCFACGVGDRRFWTGYKNRRQKQIQKDAPKQEYFDIKET